MIRATEEEKGAQIGALAAFQGRGGEAAVRALAGLQDTAVQNGNLFAALMEAVKVCSLGQVTGALFAVGGQYRRNM